MPIVKLSGRYPQQRGFVVRLHADVARQLDIEEGDFISLSPPGSDRQSGNRKFALVDEVRADGSFSVHVSQRLWDAINWGHKRAEIYTEPLGRAETVIVALPDGIRADGPLPPELRSQFNGAVVKRFQEYRLNLGAIPSAYQASSEVMLASFRDYVPDDQYVAITPETDIIAGETTTLLSADYFPADSVNRYLRDYHTDLDRRAERADEDESAADERSDGRKKGDEEEHDTEDQRSATRGGMRTLQGEEGFSAIGGYDEEIQTLREVVETPIENPELFAENGVDIPSGILLYGPQGVGKTHLAEAVADMVDAGTESLSAWDLASTLEPRQIDGQVASVIQQARNNSPSIIFIDDLEAITSDNPAQVEKYVKKKIKGIFDQIDSDDTVIVIGATNNLEGLDDSFRRPNRFGREIELQAPDAEGRREILQVLTRELCIDEAVNIDKLVAETEGYVGEDLETIVNRAALSAVKRSSFQSTDPALANADNDITLTPEDFEDAIQEVDPTNMGGFDANLPDVSWEDIGGLNDVKKQLRRVVEWPLKYPEKFDTFDIEPASGILLYGPPGTGKTMLAKALANETDSKILTVEGPELMDKWVGSSEANVRKVFQKARQPSSTVILFDEIDALTRDRGNTESASGTTERVVAQMLTELDGLNPKGDVTVIATTNQPTAIDQAFLRPGRFDYQIHVSAPPEQTRLEIFRAHTEEKPLADDVELEELAALTQGYVGADIEAVCREAAMLALDESLEDADQSDSTDAQRDLIRPKHFREALDAVGPTADEATRIKYDRIEAEMNDSDTVSVDDVDTNSLPDFPSE